MFVYEKKLQYPVKIANVNPQLASIIISQYGGPDGELGASLRYLSQRYSMPYPELKGLLTDIGTEWSKWNTPSGRSCVSRLSGSPVWSDTSVSLWDTSFFCFVFCNLSMTYVHLYGIRLKQSSTRLSG